MGRTIPAAYRRDPRHRLSRTPSCTVRADRALEITPKSDAPSVNPGMLKFVRFSRLYASTRKSSAGRAAARSLFSSVQVGRRQPGPAQHRPRRIAERERRRVRERRGVEPVTQRLLARGQRRIAHEVRAQRAGRKRVGRVGRREHRERRAGLQRFEQRRLFQPPSTAFTYGLRLNVGTSYSTVSTK